MLDAEANIMFISASEHLGYWRDHQYQYGNVDAPAEKDCWETFYIAEGLSMEYF